MIFTTTVQKTDSICHPWFAGMRETGSLLKQGIPRSQMAILLANNALLTYLSEEFPGTRLLVDFSKVEIFSA